MGLDWRPQAALRFQMETSRLLSALTDKGELLGYPAYRDGILYSCTLSGADSHFENLSTAVRSCADLENLVVDQIAQGWHDESLVGETLFWALALKKWRFTQPSIMSDLASEAISSFKRRNDIAENLPLPDPHTVDRMRAILHRWLPFVGTKDGHFGPGAVAERWSHARRWEVLTPYLTDRVTCERQSIGEPMLAASPGSALFDHCESRLCAVPKQWNKLRLITVEPAFRSFLQQGARSTLYASIHAGPLKGSAFDCEWVDGARIQQRLALLGSATGDYATIDLSEASDNITWEFVKTVFPSWVVILLEQCRTPLFRDEEGRSFPLHIYAGMGNATTFVVESLLFGAYVAAISWRWGLKARRPSVFGDDIICESRVCPYLLDAGDEFFRINTGKSFWRPGGGLRESCGVYAYKGRDVTPLRINGFRSNPLGRTGLADMLQNNWSNQQPYRVRFAHRMAEIAASRGLVRNLPFLVGGGVGYISIPSLPYSSVPTRRNKRLQRREALVDTCSPRTVEVPSDQECYLAGSLLGRIETTTTSRRRSCITFPLKDRFGPMRKRWMAVL